MMSKRDTFPLVADAAGDLYAIGGDNNIGFTASVEKLVIGSASWAVSPSMNSIRADHAAVLGSDGAIYAMGGFYNNPLSSVERFAGGSWTPVQSMAAARYNGGFAARGSDGLIYAIGDDAQGGTSTVEVYTPSTDKWSPGVPMRTPRYGHAVVAGKDGRIYAIGGVNLSTQLYSDVVEVYDPSSSQWSQLASMPTLRILVGAATAPDGRIYVFGGWDNTSILNVVEVYTP
jgi:N-acetylneuraminic acid mutarotase